MPVLIMPNLKILTNLVSNFSRKYQVARKNKLSGQRYKDLHIVKYKIVNDYDDYIKTGKLTIQSKRGSAFAHFTPQEVIEDEKILSHLHPIDATIIAKLVNEETQTAPVECEAKIVKQYFAEDKQTYVYEIQKNNVDELVRVTQFDLIDNPVLIESLSSRDAMSIGCQMGMDTAKKLK